MTLTPKSEGSDARGLNPLHANNARLALGLLLALGLIAALAVYLQNRLPEVLPEDASAAEFSAARALKHLQVIGARPHPIGSREHAAVRDYIFDELARLGLSPERQQTTAVNKRWGTPLSAGAVENVVARLKGAEGGRALLLVSHYDSMPNSPGASDDGAGVVTLLETARALRTGAPLKNDVILLFTDGEEVGLLGADAFVAEHPWAKGVGLFMNFEARGNSGPLMMFETGDGGNGEVIRQFAGAAQRPLANSFFYEIYRRLPNDTDFTVLKGLGVQGLNFAYIDGINHYHTGLDNVREINPGSLQYEGTSALALARRFGDADLGGTRSADRIYFNVFGGTFINYSAAWIIPLLVSAFLLFGVVVVRGRGAKELTISGVVLGFIKLLVGGVASTAFVWLAWWLIRAAQPAHQGVPWGEPYHSNAFRIGFVLLAVAATSATYVLLRKRSGALSFTVGALLWWLILSAYVSVSMPGGSYLFTVPLLFSLSGLALVSVLKLDHTKSQLVLALTAMPGVVLWAPMIYTLFVALTLNASWTVIIFVVLLCGLATPLILPLVNSRRWLFPGLLALACVCLVLVGILTSGFDERRPKVNHVFYALDADTGKAVFASTDGGTDAWTTQFFGAGTGRGTMPEHFPGNLRVYLKSPAPAAPLDGPEAVLTDDRTENDVRTLSFRVTSRRQAPVLSIFAEPEVEVFDSSINGKQTVNNVGNNSAPGVPLKNWGIQYHALPARGLDVVLKTRGGKPFKLFVVDRSYGLPELPGSPFKARPADMMPAPYSTSDVTLVAKSFTF
ncbi:MAG TPA: M28 family peptidase [Pyrinomonadaceae bacterium]